MGNAGWLLNGAGALVRQGMENTEVFEWLLQMSLVTILAFRNARPQRLGENREQLNLCGRGSGNT